MGYFGLSVMKSSEILSRLLIIIFQCNKLMKILSDGKTITVSIFESMETGSPVKSYSESQSVDG